MNVYDLSVATESREFTGTSNWYENQFGIIYTDGIKWLAETLNCYWLVDEIALHSRKFWKKESFMTVEFYSPIKGKGKLYITDGNSNYLDKVDYQFADLFVDSVSLHKTLKRSDKATLRLFLVYDDGANKFVLMLPSEY